jgi:hypothetical protein
MKEQPLEIPCRDGTLLINEERVMHRGTSAWALWRPQITGATCVFAGNSELATLYLHLRDGRRFALEEIAPRDGWLLIEHLGYLPQSLSPTQGDGHPLEIALDDGRTRVVADARAVTVEQDSATLWTAPHDHVLGVHITPTVTATTLQIVGRGGGVQIDAVPFAAALRLLAALGRAAPGEAEPPMPPISHESNEAATPSEAAPAQEAASSRERAAHDIPSAAMDLTRAGSSSAKVPSRTSSSPRKPRHRRKRRKSGSHPARTSPRASDPPRTAAPARRTAPPGRARAPHEEHLPSHQAAIYTASATPVPSSPTQASARKESVATRWVALAREHMPVAPLRTLRETLGQAASGLRALLAHIARSRGASAVE